MDTYDQLSIRTTSISGTIQSLSSLGDVRMHRHLMLNVEVIKDNISLYVHSDRAEAVGADRSGRGVRGVVAVTPECIMQWTREPAGQHRGDEVVVAQRRYANVKRSLIMPRGTRDTVKLTVCVCVCSSCNCSTVAMRRKLTAF